jgi:TDG/mug DNA glycosylase family protein
LKSQFMAVILPPLRDRVRPPVRVLFVGINPGMRSAALGHHFAGPSNRFWKLLFDSRLVPEPIGTEDDHRLPEWGFGITNLVPRATPGIDTLRPAEYVAGALVLRRKVRRWKPDVVALVGVTLYRAVFAIKSGAAISLGLQPESITLEGARVFVLPNPSGRNANFSYQEMLAAFRDLRRITINATVAKSAKKII